MGLDTVELVMAVEEDFGIEIPNDTAERILSVGNMRDFVVAELRRRGREADPDAVFCAAEIIVEQLGVRPSAVCARGRVRARRWCRL